MSNYRRGADKERELVNAFRAKGALAARSAGSKSRVDVWAVDGGTLFLIQCKSKREKVDIPGDASRVQVKRLLAYKDRKGWHFEEIERAA